MNRALKSCCILLLLCSAGAHAQLYKWVGPDGKVTYSDTAPPASAARVEAKPVTIGGVNAADFPYELSEAMKNHPVTLYTTRNCLACDDGRKLLTERGIPFSEKTVNSNEDIVQFRQLGGDSQLPMLVVGRNKERGFEPGAWHGTLTAAGYPETSRLPRNYRPPQAEAAAPKPAVAKQETTESAAADRITSKPTATELPPAIGNAPPGFRF